MQAKVPREDWRSDEIAFAVVMQKVSQGPNSTENADNADETEIVQVAYFLSFASGMKEIREGLAERGIRTATAH